MQVLTAPRRYLTGHFTLTQDGSSSPMMSWHFQDILVNKDKTDERSDTYIRGKFPLWFMSFAMTNAKSINIQEYINDIQWNSSA